MSWSTFSGLGSASFDSLAQAVLQKLPTTTADQLKCLQELERAVYARCRALEAEASSTPESRPPEETAARVALGGQFAQLPASGPRFTRDGSLDDSVQNRAVGGLDSGDGRREWAIPPESLDIREQIGSGSMGRVCVGNWQGTEVAVKILSDTRIAECALARRRSRSRALSLSLSPRAFSPSGSARARARAVIAVFAAASPSLHLSADLSFVRRRARAAAQTASSSCARST